MKKFFSIVLAITVLISTLSIAAGAARIKNLDLAFVIDTTGSMGDDIYQVKRDMSNYLDDLRENGLVNYRIAIVDYRDFASRSEVSADYPYNVHLDFTNDYDTIIDSINSLDLGDGGDYEETVCSALIDGLSELSWRSESGKAAILMGDAPALDPEAITNYTKDMAINKLVNDSVGYDEDMRAKTASYSVGEDEYYIADMIGMEVVTEDDEIFGTLKDVIETGANDVYVIDSEKHGEVLVPAIRECILDVDIGSHRMKIHLMAGLI